MTAPASPLCTRPPVIAAAYLIAALVLQLVVPGTKLLPAPWHWAGLAVGGAGLALMSWAFLLFQRHDTVIDPVGTPTALVTNGPYRFTRNPMYLGIALALLGVALFAGTAIVLLAPLAFVVTINARFIPRKEANLERAFGAECSDYKRRVRRWL